jgi:hypothetical protein
MRDIEIEISDQSDVIFASIAKKKKHDVQKIIDDLSFCSSKYSPELQKAIFTSAPNKAPGPDQLTFLIVQKAYNSISDVFFMLYSELINRDHHPVC